VVVRDLVELASRSMWPVSRRCGLGHPRPVPEHGGQRGGKERKEKGGGGEEEREEKRRG